MARLSVLAARTGAGRRRTQIVLALAACSTALVLFSMLASSASAGACANRFAPLATTPAADVELAVLCETNEQRAAAGLAPLVLNAQLSAAARGHALDMFTRAYFAHVSPEGRTPRDRAAAAGHSATGCCGENIAAGQTDAASVVAAWMGSPGHRANILNAGYREMGSGVAGTRTHYVQMFSTVMTGGGDGGPAGPDPVADTELADAGVSISARGGRRVRIVAGAAQGQDALLLVTRSARRCGHRARRAAAARRRACRSLRQRAASRSHLMLRADQTLTLSRSVRGRRLRVTLIVKSFEAAGIRYRATSASVRLGR